MRVVGLMVCLLVTGVATSAFAQSAIAGVKIDTSQLPSRALLTIRPQPGLEALALRVAKVLELRSGARVEVGDPPPPGLLEAVPTGHVALAVEDGSLRLVMGATGGRSLGTSIVLSDGRAAPNSRTVALAVEALLDHALEPVAAPVAARSSVTLPVSRRVSHRDETGARRNWEQGDFLESIQPLLLARLYGGGGTDSTSPMFGLGTGLGLCALRAYCALITGELPLNPDSASVYDRRYRYLTFTSGFYAQPVELGPFKPGAGVAFLTRLGRFKQDMGLGGFGLQTDLGLRAHLDMAWEFVPSMEVMTEVGLDYGLDRWFVSDGDQAINRGTRESYWLQAALRYRAY